MEEDTLDVKKFPTFPRRYEDTKPALNQALTHESILDIGQSIFQRSQENHSSTQEGALRKCEHEVWNKAEVYKDECVTNALHEARTNEEKRIKRLQDHNENNLKKQLARLEEVVYQKGMEKVFEERQAGEKKLNEVVVKLHANFATEKSAAILVARTEEKTIALRDAEAKEREHQDAMDSQHQADTLRQQESLEELTRQLTIEKEEKVEEARNEERATASQQIQEVSDDFRAQIAVLEQTISEMKETQSKTETALHAMEDLKNSYVTKLKQTRESFTAFIEKSRPDFFAGQSDFLLPDNVIHPLDDY